MVKNHSLDSLARNRVRRIALPYLIRDREYLRHHNKEGPYENDDLRSILLATPLQTYWAIDDGGFRDGPACSRAAVTDLDSENGRLRTGARFQSCGVGKTVYSYWPSLPELGPESAPEDFETDAFIQVSPFATVLKTLDFFEGPQVLGRRVSWAFPSHQLRIVPRAGEMKDAFYERKTGSLQFYYHHSAKGHVIYTSLSHDIVVHETTHAILDAIAPDLYNATTTESLALHEAIADLSSIAQTLTNRTVLFSAQNLTSSIISPPEVLSQIAEEFGSDLRLRDGMNFLRRMKHKRTLDPSDKGTDEFGIPNRPDLANPHDVSQVLSGAVYAVFEKRMNALLLLPERRDRYGFPMELEDTFYPAACRISYMVFRSLDYLPPGEATFCDYGRAFLAAAAAAYSRPRKEERWLLEEFLSRKIVDSEAEMELRRDFSAEELRESDLRRLAGDKKAATSFAEKYRELLGIPSKSKFDVLSNVVASRSLGSQSGKNRREELVFKVHWEEWETHDLGPRYPVEWAVRKGSSLIVDRTTGRILSLLTTNPSHRHREMRDQLLRRLKDDGRLLPDREAIGPDGRLLVNLVIVSAKNGRGRAQGSFATLH